MLGKSQGDDNEKKEIKWKDKLEGIMFSYISGLLDVTINTIVKKLKLHFDDVLFLTSIVQMTLALIVSFMKGNSIIIKDVDEGKNLQVIRIILIAFAIVRGMMFLTEIKSTSLMPIAGHCSRFSCKRKS